MAIGVVHCFRSPVGGVFRHVCDLVKGQSALGLSVGIICDSFTGDQKADEILQSLAPQCSLGIVRVPMGRTLGLSDLNASRQVRSFLAQVRPDVVHGHGAKGGAYTRFTADRSVCKIVYTPHGGVFHYSATNPIGAVYLGIEKYLKRKTDGQIFESQYGSDIFTQKLGKITCLDRVIYNGLSEEEFEPCITDDHTYDFVFVGELRKLKGIDVLLTAVSVLKDQFPIKVLIAGQGPDKHYFEKRINDLGISAHVTLSPPVYPAKTALIKGRCIVIPSLAESFPYIVLESVAAALPIITTNVGGIPEIFGKYADQLIPPGDLLALSQAMKRVLQNLDNNQGTTLKIQSYVKENFNQQRMVKEVVEFYNEVLQAA